MIKKKRMYLALIATILTMGFVAVASFDFFDKNRFGDALVLSSECFFTWKESDDGDGIAVSGIDYRAVLKKYPWAFRRCGLGDYSVVAIKEIDVPGKIKGKK